MKIKMIIMSFILAFILSNEIEACPSYINTTNLIQLGSALKGYGAIYCKFTNRLKAAGIDPSSNNLSSSDKSEIEFTEKVQDLTFCRISSAFSRLEELISDGRFQGRHGNYVARVGIEYIQDVMIATNQNNGCTWNRNDHYTSLNTISRRITLPHDDYGQWLALLKLTDAWISNCLSVKLKSVLERRQLPLVRAKIYLNNQRRDHGCRLSQEFF